MRISDWSSDVCSSDLAHRAQDQVVAHQRAEELRGAFFGQLRQPLLQLLELERIAQARAEEQFGREVGDAGERDRLALGEGIANRDRAVVVAADHVYGTRTGDIGRASWRDGVWKSVQS